MITDFSLRYHYRPQKGWMNDPNGLVFFDGWYHAFYQHAPSHEAPWGEPMVWGHARTKDFLHWEELPVALWADMPYDADGCWSGTAAVKDGVLYLFYASVRKEGGGEGVWMGQSVSMASSTDGIHFEKHPLNPLIPSYPADGCRDFRDPAVLVEGEDAYLVMASGNQEKTEARLLLYKSRDMVHWSYEGILARWENAVICECPSFLKFGEKYLLTASVCTETGHFFSVLCGDFDGHTFTPEITELIQKGPDQYAGQAFSAPDGRALLITWIPGWSYSNFAEKSLGCLSLPVEFLLSDGHIRAWPIREVEQLLTDSAEGLERTESGFVLHREAREDVVYTGPIRDLKVLRDNYITEVYLNGGESIYVAVNC